MVSTLGQRLIRWSNIEINIGILLAKSISYEVVLARFLSVLILNILPLPQAALTNIMLLSYCQSRKKIIAPYEVNSCMRSERNYSSEIKIFYRHQGLYFPLNISKKILDQMIANATLKIMRCERCENQLCFNIGPQSSTSAQHQNTISAH